MVDINCDMGEGMSHDALLIPFISSANIACGYHAGNNETIKRTIDLCLQHNVAIGVHPSFNDRPNFGRTEIHLSDQQLFDLVTEQLFLFRQIADTAGAAIHHVKPHGALYNMAVKNRQISAVVANAVFSFNSDLILYGLAASCMIEEGRRIGLKTAGEAFADRTYQPDGSLTPRIMQNALLSNEADVVKQVLQIVQHQTVLTITGKTIPLKADTICIHGDGEHALEFAKAIFHALQSSAIKISSL